MSKIVNMFTDSTTINDCNVACYVKKHFNVFIENQPVCGLVKHYLNKPFFKNLLTLFYINYMKKFKKISILESLVP